MIIVNLFTEKDLLTTLKAVIKCLKCVYVLKKSIK